MLATDVVVGGTELKEVINCVGSEGNIDECPRMVVSECLNIGAGVICQNGNLNEFVMRNTRCHSPMHPMHELEIEKWDQPM